MFDTNCNYVHYSSLVPTYCITDPMLRKHSSILGTFQGKPLDLAGKISSQFPLITNINIWPSRGYLLRSVIIEFIPPLGASVSSLNVYIIT